MSNSNEQEAYAAANLRERLKNIDLADSGEAYPHAGLVHDDRRLQVLNLMAMSFDGDIQDQQAYQDLVQPAGTETINSAVDQGNVSQMQYAVGLVDHSQDGQDAKTRVARMLGREGCIGLVLGPPGSGKTAFGLDVARIWKALTNGTVVSNVTSWSGTDVVVETDQEMLDAMQDTRGQVLALIDEGSQALTSRGEDQQKTNEVVKDFKLVRKKEEGDRFAKQGSIMTIGHTQRDTAAEIRRLATFAAEKPSREDPGRMVLYESEGGRDSLDRAAEYQGITDTPEDYGEHEASRFVIEDTGGDEQEDSDSGNRDRERQIKTVLRACLVQGMSYPDAAQLVDFKDSWVGDRIREWRRGDHRDLLDASAVPDENLTD